MGRTVFITALSLLLTPLKRKFGPMSRSSTALIAATTIVLPSLSQFATADKTPSTKSNSKQVASKKSGSKQQAASNYQVQMEDCDLDSDGHVDISDIVMIINEYGNDC